MNDPHVESLSYRLIPDESLVFDDPPPLEHETDEIRVLLTEDLLTVWPKAHYSSEAAAKEATDAYLGTWAVHEALESRRRRKFGFEYKGAEIVDRDPPSPDEAVLRTASATLGVSWSVAEAVETRASYPEPPMGFVFSPDAEAKRQLFGAVGIDLLAGPSEVAVIADDTADPELVAADLLGQSEHGPTSPASLVTTSEDLGRAVLEDIDQQLKMLQTADVAGAAWTNHGTVAVVDNREEAVLLMDEIAPEHLEVQTKDDDWYLENLRNYGSLFMGPKSTVAYSDKGMTGTNHVLPTAGAARYTGGLSVAKFTKTLTYQRVVSDDGTRRLAPPVMAFSQTEGLWAHEATARKRLERLGKEEPV